MILSSVQFMDFRHFNKIKDLLDNLYIELFITQKYTYISCNFILKVKSILQYCKCELNFHKVTKFFDCK